MGFLETLVPEAPALIEKNVPKRMFIESFIVIENICFPRTPQHLLSNCFILPVLFLVHMPIDLGMMLDVVHIEYLQFWKLLR